MRTRVAEIVSINGTKVAVILQSPDKGVRDTAQYLRLVTQVPLGLFRVKLPEMDTFRKMAGFTGLYVHLVTVTKWKRRA